MPEMWGNNGKDWNGVDGGLNILMYATQNKIRKDWFL